MTNLYFDKANLFFSYLWLSKYSRKFSNQAIKNLTSFSF